MTRHESWAGHPFRVFVRELSIGALAIRALAVRALARTAVGIFAVGLWGCDDSSGGAPGVASGLQIRDSAGVTIRVFSTPTDTDTILSPALQIGAEGDPDYEFFRVRNVSALQSGNIVVGNGGTSELSYFDPQGTFIRRVGGQGEGPAELGFMSWVARQADTLLVMDSSRRRVLRFDSAGTFVRGASYADDLAPLPEEVRNCSFPGLYGVLADGGRVTSGWGCVVLEGRSGERSRRVSFELVREGERLLLGRFTTTVVWERGEPDGHSSYETIPFRGRFAGTFGAEHVYLAEGVEPEIRVFDTQGDLSTILRERRELTEVTRADRDAFLAEAEESDRSLPEDLPFAEHFGSYEQLVESDSGELWARWAERPSHPVTRWTVFPENDGPTRHVVLPLFTLTAVRDGRAYGYSTDALGIQTILVFEVPEAR